MKSTCPFCGKVLPKRPVGRPRSTKYAEFHIVRVQVRRLKLKSRTEYTDWHIENNPGNIPRYPYRFYLNEWVSWYDFLGTKPRFKGNYNKKEKQ